MASPLRLTVCRSRAADTAAADLDAAWATVCEEFEASEQAMSRFRETSDLVRLDRSAGTGDPVAVPRRLERALIAADRAHRVTRGRFDPRVLRDLERLGYAGARMGGDRLVARDDRRIVCRVGPGRVTVDEPIDLGGIGKGLALRWAAAALARVGLDRILLEAGGDMVVSGAGPDGAPWLVGIEDPLGAAEPLAGIEVDRGAVATSSVRRRSWVQDGREVHHLLDPHTGEPADGGLRAVTVHAPDPAWAEVWSKTLFIGGRAAIAAEARSRGLAAWWVSDDGGLEMTPAARVRTAWVANEG